MIELPSDLKRKQNLSMFYFDTTNKDDLINLFRNNINTRQRLRMYLRHVGAFTFVEQPRGSCAICPEQAEGTAEERFPLL